MKKNKEWAQKEVDRYLSYEGVNEARNALVFAKGVIDQLDEPEVLSQEWIENKKWQAYDPDARTLYWAVTETDLENLLVPKQELPVIPKYVADWIEDLKSKNIHLLDSIYDFTHGEDIHDYMRKHGDVLMRAWLDGFTVEKEQKYYVMKDGVVILSKRYRDYDSHKSHWIGTVTNQEYIKENPGKVRFTEQEIKDFDERFWAFAVPVEEVDSI